MSGPNGTPRDRQRTLLQALAQRRHLTREQTIEVLERRAREMDIRDFSLSLRQLDRWFAGGVATLPRPQVRRVIEAEFGYPAHALLGPATAIPIGEPKFGANQRDRWLKTVDFVSWIADQAEHDFHDVYVAVAEMADKLSAIPPAARATKEHARSVLTRADIAGAVQRYYDSPPTGFYCAAFGEHSIASLSMLTNRQWIGLAVPLDAEHEQFRLSQDHDAQRVNLPATALQAAINRLAAVEVDDTVLLDNPLYRLLDVEVHANHVGAALGLTTFAAYALTADLLEVELIDSLVPSGLERAQEGLPLRDIYLPSIRAAMAFDSRICAGGPACLTAIAQPDDYLLLLQQRSSRVVNVAGRLSVIPKAFHQPLTENQGTALSASIARELEEELLGREDLEQLSIEAGRRAAPGHPLATSRPMQWLLDHPDSYRLQCTGFGINMLSGNYEFACLAIIDDPVWWATYGHLVEANWEVQRFRSYSSKDTDGISQLISDPRWSNEGLFALLEGLRCLANHNPSKVALPEIEVSV